MAKTPTNATEYLKSLLDFAAETIPTAKHKDTPCKFIEKFDCSHMYFI